MILSGDDLRSTIIITQMVFNQQVTTGWRSSAPSAE